MGRIIPCPGCGGEIPAAARFCPGCGKPVIGAAAGQAHAALAAASSSSSSLAASTADRRQITILFCDLVDSTGLSGTLDPEDLRELIHDYHRVCAAVISRFDGSIAQYLGDGLLVYFGYPRAHEDDARRALHTALGILESIGGLNERLRRLGTERLRVRIGIHTGLVVVGDVGEGRQEQLAIGEVPNIAARLQSAAEPDSIVVSGATQRLIRERFDWQDRGELALKGVIQPVHAFSLVRQTVVEGKNLPPKRLLKPIAGREAELSLLAAAWKKACGGAGVVISVSGEAGIGKSRLLDALHERALKDRKRALVLRCSPYHATSELHPVVERFEAALGLAHADAPDERFAKLERGLRKLAPSSESVALLAALVSIPLPAGIDASNLSPVVTRQRTYAALSAWLLGQAMAGPVVIACEDLHWADPSTLEFLALFIQQMAAAPVLLVLTFRPEFNPPWTAPPDAVHITLSRLGGAAAQAIVARLTGGKALPAAILQTVLANTDGVPLFVEEFTSAVLESGLLVEHDDRYELAGDLPAGLIPQTLRDSLTARLDRLGPARTIARHAAVIGRRFDRDLLDAISTESASRVAQGLSELEAADLVHGVAAAPRQYEFKHALVQVAAYESLLRRDRIDLHMRVAGEMERALPDLVERQPHLLAHHLAGAQQWARAIDRWLAAGQRNLVRSANAEAITNLRTGLSLLPNVPAEQRAPLELALLTTIGPALIATTGFGSTQVGRVYTRARELCDVLEGRAEFFPALWGSWVYHHVRGECRAGQKFAERMLKLAGDTNDDTMRVEAHWTLGNSCYWLGELEEADRHLSAATGFYSPERHAGNALAYGQDPAVAAECYRSFALWMLGLPDQSLAALSRAGALAAARDHPFTTAWALAFEFMVYMYRQEPKAALAAADRALAFCNEQGTPFWISSGIIVRGWARARLGELGAGIDEMRQGLQLYEAIGSRVVQPLWFGLLAEALLTAERHAEARAALASGFAIATANEERVSEIDLWRIQGDLDCSEYPEDRERACRSYRRALEMAEQHRAASLGLRAATGLHKALAADGETVASPLAALLQAYREGQDTPDVRLARAMLR